MDEWIKALCAELGLDIEVDIQAILDVARDAAHGVERPAAPVSTFLMGYAVAAGADPADVATRIGRLAAEWNSAP